MTRSSATWLWWFAAIAGSLAASCGGCSDRQTTESWEFDSPTSDAVVPVDTRDSTSRPEDSTAPADSRSDTHSPDVPPPTTTCVVEHPATGHEPQLQIEWTADDWLEGWLDGRRIGASDDWRNVKSLSRSAPRGRHVLAVRAEDRARVVTGFIAALQVGEESPDCMQTGRGSAWRVTGSSPRGRWRRADYDDSDWTHPPPVADQRCRNSWDGTVDIDGAEWVWESDCQVGNSGWNEQNWYRLVFEVQYPD